MLTGFFHAVTQAAAGFGKTATAAASTRLSSGSRYFMCEVRVCDYYQFLVLSI